MNDGPNFSSNVSPLNKEQMNENHIFRSNGRLQKKE